MDLHAFGLLLFQAIVVLNENEAFDRTGLEKKENDAEEVGTNVYCVSEP